MVFVEVVNLAVVKIDIFQKCILITLFFNVFNGEDARNVFFKPERQTNTCLDAQWFLYSNEQKG